MDSPNQLVNPKSHQKVPPVKIAEQDSLKGINKEEYEFIESLQANYEEQSTSNHNGGYCFCIKKILGQLWCLLVYGTAGILNILDSALIKIVNRFYYHNI